MDVEKARSKIISVPIKELRNDLLLESHLQRHLSLHSPMPSYKFPFYQKKDVGGQSGYIAKNTKGMFMMKHTQRSLSALVIDDACKMLKARQNGKTYKILKGGRKDVNFMLYRNNYELLIEYLSGPLFDYFLGNRTASIGLVFPHELETTTYLCNGRISRKSFDSRFEAALITTRSKFIEDFVTIGSHLGYDSGAVIWEDEDIRKIKECGDVDAAILPSFFLGDSDFTISNYGFVQGVSTSSANVKRSMKVDHGKSLMCFFSSVKQLRKTLEDELRTTNFEFVEFNFLSFCQTVMKFAHTPNVFWASQMLRRADELSAIGYKAPNILYYYLDGNLQVVQFKDAGDKNTAIAANLLIRPLEKQFSVIRVLHLNLVLYKMVCAERGINLPVTMIGDDLSYDFFKNDYIESVVSQHNAYVSWSLKARFLQGYADFIVSNNLLHMFNLPLSFFSRDVVECSYEDKLKLHLQDPLQYALTHDMAISGKKPVAWFLQHYNREDLSDDIKDSVHKAMLDFCKRFPIYQASVGGVTNSQAIELRNFIHKELELNYKDASTLSVVGRNEREKLSLNISALEKISVSSSSRSIKSGAQNGRNKV